MYSFMCNQPTESLFYLLLFVLKLYNIHGLYLNLLNMGLSLAPSLVSHGPNNYCSNLYVTNPGIAETITAYKAKMIFIKMNVGPLVLNQTFIFSEQRCSLASLCCSTIDSRLD